MKLLCLLLWIWNLFIPGLLLDHTTVTFEEDTVLNTVEVTTESSNYSNESTYGNTTDAVELTEPTGRVLAVVDGLTVRVTEAENRSTANLLQETFLTDGTTTETVGLSHVSTDITNISETVDNNLTFVSYYTTSGANSDTLSYNTMYRTATSAVTKEDIYTHTETGGTPSSTTKSTVEVTDLHTSSTAHVTAASAREVSAHPIENETIHNLERHGPTTVTDNTENVTISNLQGRQQEVDTTYLRTQAYTTTLAQDTTVTDDSPSAVSTKHNTQNFSENTEESYRTQSAYSENSSSEGGLGQTGATSNVYERETEPPTTEATLTSESTVYGVNVKATNNVIGNTEFSEPSWYITESQNTVTANIGETGTSSSESGNVYNSVSSSQIQTTATDVIDEFSGHKMDVSGEDTTDAELRVDNKYTTVTPDVTEQRALNELSTLNTSTWDETFKDRSTLPELPRESTTAVYGTEDASSKSYLKTDPTYRFTEDETTSDETTESSLSRSWFTTVFLNVTEYTNMPVSEITNSFHAIEIATNLTQDTEDETSTTADLNTTIQTIQREGDREYSTHVGMLEVQTPLALVDEPTLSTPVPTTQTANGTVVRNFVTTHSMTGNGREKTTKPTSARVPPTALVSTRPPNLTTVSLTTKLNTPVSPTVRRVASNTQTEKSNITTTMTSPETSRQPTSVNSKGQNLTTVLYTTKLETSVTTAIKSNSGETQRGQGIESVYIAVLVSVPTVLVSGGVAVAIIIAIRRKRRKYKTHFEHGNFLFETSSL